MKKTVWTYGTFSAALLIALMAVIVPQLRAHRMGLADTLGYTSMLVAALVIFFGIRSYRQNAGQGRLTFGRGFAVGLLITVVSAAFYAAAFLILYFYVAPDFGEIFSACMVERQQLAGAGPQEIAATAEQAAALKRLYDQPLTNVALSFGTSLPVGIAASAIAAAILRRR